MSNPVPAPLPLPAYVDVALPLPMRRVFTYRLAEAMRADVKIGARLLVPFGKRSLTGYAVELFDTLPRELGVDEAAVKDVAELLDDDPLITSEILKLTQWTADYYFSSWGEMLKASLPAGINAATEQVVSITEDGRQYLLAELIPTALKASLLASLAENGELRQRALESEFGAAKAKRVIAELSREGLVTVRQQSVPTKVRPKRRKAVRLVSTPADEAPKPPTAAQQRVIDALETREGEMMFTDLIDQADVSASTITTLAKHGRLEVFEHEVRRDPLSDAALPAIANFELNPEQAEALSEIEGALQQHEFKAFLLHGITGSGKTEVYIRAMRIALDLGRSALMLVPEIALTPVFSRRLRAVFGNEVAILHSNLSPGERYDEWRRLRRGDARVAIGTRSAVFAPLMNIGLVIVDEEHDTSYRQNESPFYHGRDVAVKRAYLAGAAVVLGSATPAIESFHNARSDKYKYIHLPERIGKRPLAAAEIIDMREVFKIAGKDVAFSPALLEAIEETHRKGEQSIMLLNRRGFSQFVMCRTCGETLRCKNCDITLTFHKGSGQLVCHYCNYRINAPRKCPFCDSEYLYFIGEGTEQLEEILKKKFPQMRIDRIDRDTASRRKDLEKTLLAFSSGDIDMLVGTQMIAKGHDFPNVTLVGVVSVDLGLGLPDFRAAERTFQLVTQVAGRAGRGDLPGRVMIQTYYPEHYVLRHAVSQDYEGFYAEETRFRERMAYPPYSVLASILIKHTDLKYAQGNAQVLRTCLDDANTEKQCRILGVAPASISRLKGEYRLQILIKSQSRKKLRETLDIALAAAEAKKCDMRMINVEIDPVNML